ncbi:DUF6244 family protein [Nocardioides speluncae]|uniref:DUF6244 family protein n=1 Tax=Nocardioides speluncae TaxID=2670337 RepID=UPI000D69892F|nr:DUF6244 family protein [Nocardioides speluncae]
MAEVAKVVDALKEGASGLDAATGAVQRARHHARQVEQRLGKTGLTRMARGIGDVVQSLGKIGQALVAEQKTLGEAAARVATVPKDPTGDDVVSDLEPAGKQIGDIPGRLQGVSNQVDGLQSAVATVLKGSQPGPLLALLEDIKKPLPGVIGAVSAAVQRNDEVIGEARGAGDGGKA